MKNLSSLERASLDEQWNDADSLATWLAHDESLAQLGDALDLQLILRDTDVLATEPHRVPLLCEDLHQEGRSVVVQPQVEAAVPGQLGSLLLQAAALDATAVVWVAASFPPSLRATLEWLNRKTYHQCAFYVVELQLWRIGTSSPAPRFEVVVRPSEGKEAVDAALAYRRATSSFGARPRHPVDLHVDDHLRAEDWLHHWQEFVDYAAGASGAGSESNEPAAVPLPQPAARSWIEIPFDFPGIRVTLAHSARVAETSIFVLARRQPTPNLHRALERHQAQIEAALGTGVQWHLSPEEGDYIGFAERLPQSSCSLPSAIRTQREEHFARLLEILSRLRAVLEDVVKAAHNGEASEAQASAGESPT